MYNPYATRYDQEHEAMEREARERDFEVEQAQEAARAARDADEYAFEMREAAAQAEQYRLTDLTNTEILRIFDAACAKVASEVRRAA